MKKQIICALFLFPFAAHAETMKCTISEILDTHLQNRTEINYETSEAGGHGIQPFDVTMATGFVAISNGYTVIQIQTKADKRAFSFHAKRNGVDSVVGATCLADASTCIEVGCL